MNKNPIVDEYLEKKNHPLTQEIERVREITHEHMKISYLNGYECKTKIASNLNGISLSSRS